MTIITTYHIITITITTTTITVTTTADAIANCYVAYRIVESCIATIYSGLSDPLDKYKE